MMDFVFVILNVSLLFTIAWQMWKRQDALRQLFWAALAFKVCCGILLGLLYSYYYSSGDTFSFFEDGKTLSALARSDFNEYVRFLWSGGESFSVWHDLNHQQYRSLFFTKCISIINLFTGDNYWLTSIYFSFISFLGSIYLAGRLIEIFPGSIQTTAISFLFFPSVVFWSSGVIKESIALPGIFFLSGFFLILWSRRNLKLAEWILVLPVIWCVWNLKYFYLAVFLPVAVTTLITKAAFKQSLNKARFISQLFVWFLIFGVCLFAISFLHPNFRLSYLPEVIVKNNEAYTRLSSPDNLILFKNLEPDFFSMARHSPQALLSGIFRPGIWEASSVLKFLSAMENLFLAILIALTLMRRKAISRQNRLLTFAVLIYIVLLCVLLTLATPNLGTLVRYRVGFIPFLVYLLLHGSNITKSLERLFVRLVRHK